jgi:hypothetical protein
MKHAPERFTAMCMGKRTYETFTEASKIAKRMNRQHDGGSNQAYSCRSCSKFHVGEKFDSRRDAETRKRRLHRQQRDE